MVYRGIVFENNIDYIVVFTKDLQYLKIKKKGEVIVGKEIIFLEDDIIKENKKNHQVYKVIAAVFLILIFSSTLVFQFGVNFLENIQTYGIVSLDINPSLQFEINKKEKVKKVVSLNEDGKSILDNNMIGMAIQDAVLLGIENAIEKNYINEQNNTVLIADVISENNNDLKLNIQNKIQKSIEEKVKEEVELIYLSSNTGSIKEAKNNKISVGKYEMYKIISEKKVDISIKEIEQKSINAIIKENKESFKNKSIELLNKKTDKNNKGMDKKHEKEIGKDRNEEKNQKKEDKREEKDKDNKSELKEEKKDNKEDKRRKNLEKDDEDKDNERKNNIKNEVKNNNSEKSKEKINKDKNNNKDNHNHNNSHKKKENTSSKDNNGKNNKFNNKRSSH